MAKTVSLLASRTPVRLEVFLQFSFSNIVFMFLLNYTCSVLRSRNSGKAIKFLSRRLVLLLYGNQYRNPCFVHKTTYLWSMRSPGGVGNCLFLRARGWGIDCQVRTKLQIPGSMPGGMVTGRIEPCINCNVYRDSDSKTERFFLPTIRPSDFFDWSTNKSKSKQPSPQAYRGTTKKLENNTDSV